MVSCLHRKSSGKDVNGNVDLVEKKRLGGGLDSKFTWEFGVSYLVR